MSQTVPEATATLSLFVFSALGVAILYQHKNQST